MTPSRTRLRQDTVVRLRFAGADYECLPSETVLEALLRQGVDMPYSCGKGVCLSCIARLEAGAVPEEALEGLRPVLRDQGYFLPCVCTPTDNLEMALPEDGGAFVEAKVVGAEPLAPTVCRVLLQPATRIDYHAGQFINLRRGDGVTRSYSLASAPGRDTHLEIHVKRLPGGVMSNWICDRLRPGQTVDIQGPNGTAYYLPARPGQPLLLIGNGTGLAPLIGIVREALACGHAGPIHLFHGTRQPAGLYRHRELAALAAIHDNFHYAACLSGPDLVEDCRAGRAEAVALAEHTALAEYRVFICGYAPMVHAAKKTAYLAGAAMADIHADAFELRELRRKPRL